MSPLFIDSVNLYIKVLILCCLSNLWHVLIIYYFRDFLEEEQNCGSNSTTSGGGEKRALDLSPGAQGSPWQLSPENKKRCVLDPMVASFSSSKNIMDLGALQVHILFRNLDS